MPDVYGGAKPKVAKEPKAPKEPKSHKLPECTVLNEETDTFSGSHPRVSRQTGGRPSQPCDNLKSGKCDKGRCKEGVVVGRTVLGREHYNKPCKKLPNRQDAGKISDTKFQTTFGKRMPRNECKHTSDLNRNLDATNVTGLDVSEARLKDLTKHKSTCKESCRNKVCKHAGQKMNCTSSDCDMDKVLDKLNNTDGTSHLTTSSSSLDSDWLQSLSVANQNTQDLSWDCECTKVPGYKCNCDSDWTFKLPGVCDNDCKRKTAGMTQVPACTGGERGRKPRKMKRERKSMVCSADVKEKVETSSDDEQYELVFDHRYGEVVRRAKSREKPSPLKQASSLPDRERISSTGLARAENIRRTDRDSSSPECTLKHALPYLPARLRNRLTTGQTGQSITDSSFTNGHSKHPSESGNYKHGQYADTNLQPIGVWNDGDKNEKGTRPMDGHATWQMGRHSTQPMDGQITQLLERQVTQGIQRQGTQPMGMQGSYPMDGQGNQPMGEQGTQSVAGQASCRCDKKVYNYKNLLSANRDKGSLKWIDEDLQTFEDSVEDPFRVKHVDFNQCLGINALIDGIDVPFIDLSDNDDDTMASYGNVGRRFEMPDSEYTRQCKDAELLEFVKDTHRNLDCDWEYDLREDKRHGTSLGTSLEASLQTVNRGLSEDSESDEAKTSNQKFTNTFDDFESFRSRSDSAEDSSPWEADDEFECECGACSLLEPRLDVDHDEWDFTQPEPQEERMFSVGEDLLDLESLLGFTDSEGDSHVLSVSIGRPVSASLEFIDTSLRQMRMIQAVVEQMLTLQPDLLSSPATPAAPEAVIDGLPVVTLTTDTLEQHPSCPICLSPCESGDRMSQLPCQHIFHPACARAWLLKSGTCPVCRQKVVQ